VAGGTHPPSRTLTGAAGRRPPVSIGERLSLLYGSEVGERTAWRLERLLDGFRTRLRPPDRDAGGRFDQRDILLITYGDTLLADGAPPLSALNEFASSRLEGRVSGIHLLPFFPYSSDYGFSVVDYLRVDPELGGWDQVSALSARFRLMFDFVLNHVSAKSAWFQAFLRGEPPYDEFFITVDPRTDLSQVVRPRTSPLLTRFESSRGPQWVWTTFSADQVDLDYRNPEVLLRMAEVMLSYVERGADLLRMDAVAYLWKEIGTSCVHLPQTHGVVKLLRLVLDEVAPQVAIVTETNVPQRENVTYFGDGYDEAQLVYQFPLAPLVLDALARGDAGHLVKWAAEPSPPSDQTSFLNFLASHDGIGVLPARGLLSDQEVDDLVARVRAHGGEVSYRSDADGSESVYELNATLFDALSDPRDRTEPWQTKLERFLCSQAIMLALAGVPGLYVHSLFGSHNDHQGFARSGWRRDLNHQRLSVRELEARLAEPWSETAQVFAGYSRLLEARRLQQAFHPNSPQRVLAAGPGVFAFERGPWQGHSILAFHNLTATEQIVPQPGAAGSVDVITGRRFPPGGSLKLGPYQVLWLQAPGD
jgi:glucosylglycerate phosphorylase